MWSSMSAEARAEAAAPGRASGTFAIGGELRVHRLGFGAMRLPAAWGEEESPGTSREMLREVLRLGVDFIDTAHAYGRSEEVIAEALHPYPEGLVIATKGGLRRGGDPDGRPERLRADCEDSLRRLRLDTIDLWQLHRIDPAVPVEEQFGTIRELRDEGKIRFVGVSEVSAAELEQARVLVDAADPRREHTGAHARERRGRAGRAVGGRRGGARAAGLIVSSPGAPPGGCPASAARPR